MSDFLLMVEKAMAASIYRMEEGASLNAEAKRLRTANLVDTKLSKSKLPQSGWALVRAHFAGEIGVLPF